MATTSVVNSRRGASPVAAPILPAAPHAITCRKVIGLAAVGFGIACGVGAPTAINSVWDSSKPLSTKEDGAFILQNTAAKDRLSFEAIRTTTTYACSDPDVLASAGSDEVHSGLASLSKEETSPFFSAVLSEKPIPHCKPAFSQRFTKVQIPLDHEVSEQAMQASRLSYAVRQIGIYAKEFLTDFLTVGGAALSAVAIVFIESDDDS